MSKRRKYPKFLVITAISCIFFNSFLSLVSANNIEEVNSATIEQVGENSLLETQASSETSEEPESPSIPEASIKLLPESSPDLETEKEKLIHRLESMAHELVLLRVQAFEAGNTKLAKEIEQIENDLLIEKTKIIQQSEARPKKKALETEIWRNRNLENTVVRLSNLEDQYMNDISEYKKQLNPTIAMSIMSKSASIGKVGDGQSITAGSEATVSVKKTSEIGSIYIEVLNEAGTLIASQQLDQPTDTPAYIWSTSPATPTGTYTIVFQYPGTSENEDRFTIYVNPVPESVEIKENTSVDVRLTGENYEVYQFTPSATQTYQIKTSPSDRQEKNGGSYTSANDTWLGIYKDAELTELVQSNEDRNGLFSEVITDLQADTAYYVALKSSNQNDVNAKLNISVMEEPIIYTDSPLDIEVPPFKYKVVKFCSVRAGSFEISTGSTPGGPDTALWLYGDANLTQELAYNDEAPGTRFTSQIIYNMSPETCYYIKVAGAGDYMEHNLNIRLSIQLVSGGSFGMTANEYLDINMGNNERFYFSFTPAKSTYYTLFTSPYGRGTQYSDTVLYLYDDAAFRHQIAYSDDLDQDGNSGESRSFSAITYPMSAGKTYYIALEDNDDQAFLARFMIKEGWKDFYEPNDSIDTAYPVTPNQIYKALLEAMNDMDYFQFVSEVDGMSYVTLKVPPDAEDIIWIYEENQGQYKTIAVKDSTWPLPPEGELLDVSFPTTKGKRYIIRINPPGGTFNPNEYYVFKLTQGRNNVYTYTKSGRLDKQTYESGLYKYEIKYIYDNNGNLITTSMTKTEITQ